MNISPKFWFLFINVNMEMHWFLWIMTVLVEYLSAVQAHDCESSESIMCRDELDNLLAHGQPHNFVDKDHLNHMCEKQLKALQCVKTYAESCLPPEQQKVFQVLTQGSDQFFFDFCSDGSVMRTEYQKHSPCIKTISHQLDECATEYEVSQQLIDENETDTESLKEKTCCIYFENIQCASNATTAACGEVAAKTVTKLWTLLGGTYLNQICESYAKHYFGDCLPVSRSSRSIQPSYALYLLPFVLYRTFSLYSS